MQKTGLTERANIHRNIENKIPHIQSKLGINQKTPPALFPMIQKHTAPRRQKVNTWLRSFTLGVAVALMTSLPVKAAESIFFIYGPLKFSLRVESLENFAKDGAVNKNLELFLRGTTKEQQEEYRRALLERADVDPLLVARFFNTDIGADMLNRLGRLINIQGGGNGKFALRGALIQAAMSPDGLTLLNFMNKLPTNMQINLSNVVQLSRAINIVVEATKEFTDNIAQLSQMEAQANPPVDFSKLPSLSEPGPYGVQPREVWNLTDTKRNRTFYVNVYKPQKWRSGQTPVVVISHGLASRPEDFSQGAEHLASYGFVVVVPQHPGSDLAYAKALIEGTRRDVFDVNDFINRPKDVSYVIDELERRNQQEFGGRLNLKSVGAIGHSFGGYTVLALAGARIDFDNLQKDCDRQFSALNTSLFLQCRALSLPRQDYNFKDERIAAIFAANPVNTSIFGQQQLSQINIPVFIGAGTYDPATPFVFEQGRSFPWFTTPNKYLLLVEGQAHVDFSQLDANVTNTIKSIDDFTLPSPYLIHTYVRSFGAAFFGFYIAGDQSFQPYLQASYAAYLSQGEQFKAFLITGASSAKLEQKIEEFRQRHSVNK